MKKHQTTWLFMVFPLLASLILAPAAGANSAILGHPIDFLTTHHDELLGLNSAEDAVQLFLSSGLTRSPQPHPLRSSTTRSSKIDVPVDIQESITQTMAALTAMAYMKDLSLVNIHQTPNGESPAKTSSAPPPTWITGLPPFEQLDRISNLHKMVTANDTTAGESWDTNDQVYLQFIEYYDQKYPMFTEGPASWIQVYLDQGRQGLLTRLQEFWQTQKALVPQSPLSDSQKTVYSERFLSARFVPLLRTYLTNQVLSLQTKSLEMVITHLSKITNWQEQKREHASLWRVCGSWLWTVHNHQNHQDHKITVNFFPPGQPAPANQPTPTTVKVQGDTVYLEWTFPQGRQEDSLLLSNRDTIMEGTFKNSLGPYGSISGKRLSTCKP